MRKTLVFLNLVCTTIFLSLIALLISFFDKEGKRIAAIARFWARGQLKVSGITVQVQGAEILANPPYAFMCNHQSALDIFALLSALPLSFKWIAKRELFRIPFLGWAMKRAGYISLDRDNPREALKAIDNAGQKIREGTNIIIFPEGTRSDDGRLLPFKKGGFTLALRAKVPIVPVGICGTSILQPKGSFLPKAKGVVYVRIGEPIHLSGERAAKSQVMDEVKKRIEGLMACQES
jgi:1-acyl-sn-glycerol-3-phosphate acyltransferase